ncbi:exodeoxyribonuclease V subunit alpha [Hydrocarboniphaga sp.]|uniref:exodeoxyribonuclease V subunit alpha n=1 Tax=Hydrocarboniphaga sp. TaxID=2033016 RepID=UPI003D112F82
MSLADLRLPLPPPGIDDAAAAFAASFAAAVASVHEEQGGAAGDRDDIYLAARQASIAVQEGHAGADLALLADDGIGIDLGALQRSPVVGDGSQPTPLVLQGRLLYLYRYWRYERLLATRLLALNRPVEGQQSDAVRAQLDALFAGDAAVTPNWQKVAAATALTRHLCVISGGPGTGKTTTVVRILAAALSLHGDAVQPLRIAIAAPTGKAAARLKSSIQAQLSRMQLADDIVARLPAQAYTLHRLLGVRPGRVGFRHDAAHPLPYDLIVVDEASMIDLALAAKLVDALLPTARLILLGDKDQLASVEAGAVYAELSARSERDAAWCATLAALSGEQVAASMVARSSSLTDAVVWLTHAYRFDAGSGIAALATAINAGDIAQVRGSLSAEAGPRWQAALPSPAALAASLAQGYENYLDAVNGGASPSDVLRAFDRYRVLCATRSGSYGSEALARHIALQLRRALPAAGASAHWYAGRAVMITGNDYALQLYNGDIGVALPDESGRLLVHFAGDAGLRAFAPGRLSAVDTAFALTVHKSQGSEFDAVDVVVDGSLPRGLNRQLLYTAVTRARSSVRLWCDDEALTAMVGTRLSRRSSIIV